MEESSGNVWKNDIIFEDNIISAPRLNFEPDPRGVGYYIMKSITRNKYKVAQFVADTGEQDSYKQFGKRCIRTALHLLEKGLTSSDIICVCSHNHKDTCVPYIAAFLSGVMVCCLDPSLGVPDAEYLLNLVKPKLVFVSEEAINLIETTLENIGLDAEIIVFGETYIYTPFSFYLEPIDSEDDFEPVAPGDLLDTAAIYFSSGTTGLPKGVLLSHYALIVQPYYLTQNGTIEDNTIVLCYSSLYWISSTVFLLAAIYAGRPRMVCKSFDAEYFWNLIEKYKITMAFLSPSQCAAICKYGRPDNVNTSSFVYVVSAGGPLPMNRMFEIRDLLPGTWIAQAYGSTEMVAVVTVFNPKFAEDSRLLHYKPQSCGRPVAGISYKVVDLNTEEPLGPFEQGELRIKSRAMTTGFYNMDSSSAFDFDGWLKTGDIVYYDEDFCFYIVDRIKQMLKYRSWQIAPAVIEDVLQQHRSVKMAVVIGLPHPEDGDHPMAIVVKHEDDETDESEIENFVNEKVSDKQQLRAGVKFVDELPLTPSGKVKRRELRDMVINGEI